MRLFSKEKDQLEEQPSEIEELKQDIRKAGMPEAVAKVAYKEIERMAKISSASSEYTIGFNYIDYLVTLPWKKLTNDNLDIQRAESILNEDHFGLEKIKDRILEHLSVRALKMSGHHKILVVDDEEITRRNLAHVFSKDGYHVQTAADGTEALASLEKVVFDIIVTDLKMKTVDGMAVLERAREINPDTEVIIMTGYATVSTAIEAMQKGSYHYLAKPLKLDEIRSTVQKALYKKKARLEPKGPVLCFAGPPGTGKTSLGMSIARSLERKFIRISLAGMKDEAEIRGHRKSYVGALPGRIIQEIRPAETRNPVIMLDEIDKLGRDFKGDPAAALLEVLDPEQNEHFNDLYLDVPFDLSRVMFIATANLLDMIPDPLLDRLEVITLLGYTEEEKEENRPPLFDPPGNRGGQPFANATPFLAEAAIRKITREYTREAGLRNLKRQIAAICRKIARETLRNPDMKPQTRQYHPGKSGTASWGPGSSISKSRKPEERAGVATGLAWTESGGQIMFVEAAKMKGKGALLF